MKLFKLIFLSFFTFLFFPTEKVEAQVRRGRTVVVTTNANKRQIRRQTRRQVRRIHRRNRFRTFRTLPPGTRAVTFRRVNYYPLNGAYYVRRNGVYIRQLPPAGFRVARLTGRLVRLSLRNRNYVYAQGIFYTEVDNEFEIADAPKGAVIDELPEEVEEIILDDMTAYELYDVLYTKTDKGYEVLGQLEEFED